MNVIGLDGELVQAEPEALASIADRTEDLGADQVAAEARQSFAQAERRVKGRACVVARACDMRDTGAPIRALASGSPARSTPSPEFELVLTDRSTTSGHHDMFLSSTMTALGVARSQEIAKNHPPFGSRT